MAKKSVRHGTNHVQDVFKMMIEEMGASEKFGEAKVINLIPELLGTAISNKIEERYIYDKKLYLRTYSAPLKQELLYIKDAILNKIQDQVGMDVITDVVVR